VAAGLAFPHASQAIQIVRRRKVKGKWSRETCDAVTSLTVTQASYAQLAVIIRGHCGIEDRLHWVRDSTSTRTAPGPAPPAARASWPACATWPSPSCGCPGGQHRRRPALPRPAAKPAPTDDHEVLAGAAEAWAEAGVSRRSAEIGTLPQLHPLWHRP
jgi:hypothetical protein